MEKKRIIEIVRSHPICKGDEKDLYRGFETPDEDLRSKQSVYDEINAIIALNETPSSVLDQDELQKKYIAIRKFISDSLCIKGAEDQIDQQDVANFRRFVDDEMKNIIN